MVERSSMMMMGVPKHRHCHHRTRTIMMYAITSIVVLVLYRQFNGSLDIGLVYDPLLVQVEDYGGHAASPTAMSVIETVHNEHYQHPQQREQQREQVVDLYYSSSANTTIRQNSISNNIIINNNNKITSSNSKKNSNNIHPPPTTKWAYAFLISGCDPEHKPYKYRPLLYNTIIAANILQRSGSNADIIQMIQLSSSTSSTSGRLPIEDIELLQTFNIKIHYISQYKSSIVENFYSAIMEKFRILELTNYTRVMFLDSDIMPFCNLDYLFQLSDPEEEPSSSSSLESFNSKPNKQLITTNKNNNKTKKKNHKNSISQSQQSQQQGHYHRPLLKPNIVISVPGNPSHGGLFVFQPGLEKMKQLLQIIHHQEQLALQGKSFSTLTGWGTPILTRHGDYWITNDNKTCRLWNFPTAWADQGLIYHWSKYIQKNVSLIVGRNVEHWSRPPPSSSSSSSTSVIIKDDDDQNNGPTTTLGIITNLTTPIVRLEGIWTELYKYTCIPRKVGKPGWRHAPFYRDFFHFSATKKPWYVVKEKPIFPTNVNVQELPNHLKWFYELQQLEMEHNLTINWTEFLGQKAPLGGYAIGKHRMAHIRSKAKTNWDPYR